MTRAGAALVLLAAEVLGACGAAAPVTKPTGHAVAPKTMRVVREPGRPAIAIVTREGDPEAFVAAFVATNGIGDRGAVVPVALAGLFQSRLPSARVVPQADGVRVVAPAGELAHVATALMEPVTAATDLAIVKKKVGALASLPRPSAEELPIALCEGAIVPPADSLAPSNADLEAWRARAVVNERVGFGAVGAWPRAPALASGSRAPANAQAASFAAFDAGDVPAGSADISIAWRAGFSAVSAAAALGDPRSSLVMMLAAENVAHVRSASGTLSPDGACLALRLRVVADAATSGGAQRISRAIALAQTKARDALADATNDLATPSDAAAAAEQASLVALAPDAVATTEPYLVVGASGATNETRESLAKALADATRAWTSPIVESRSRIERGQPAAWMLVASPCGTAGEADTDAGSSAAFAVAASNAARAHGVASEPWIAGDGVGVLASAPSARLLADALARTVLVEPLEGVRAAQGLLHDAARPGLAGLALALAPGHPASIVPTGTPLSLLRVSEPAILARAESLRHGPLRVALLDNDESTADAAIARVDRWVLREGARACPAQAAIAPPKPGMYAVATDDGTSEAYLALAIPAQYEAEASVIAGVLDRDLLAKALSDGLARESSARVLGPAGGRALVIHVEAPASALDAAVAQTRALLDRVRQGAIAEPDLARHSARVREESAVKMRDPRERLIALFRGEPARADVGLDRVRTAAAAFVHDDALVTVAARPRTKRTP